MKNTVHSNLLRKATSLGMITLTLGTVSLFAADPETRPRNNNTTAPAASENSPSYDSDRNRRTADATSTVSKGDKKFLLKAAEHGKAEVKLSSLAAERATDPAVRSYAQRLVIEHEQANLELAELARRKGVDLMSESKEGHENKHADKLSDKSGAEFDKTYIKEMASAHDDVVDLFEGAAKKADDPEIAAFANKLLPTLRDHHVQAQSLQKTLKK